MTSSDSRVPESNPFVEIATHLFLEDLAAKVGVPGLNNYLVSLAKSLARSMPSEEYASWPEFLDAVKSRQSILSTFEEIRPVTERCMASPRSPFERGWREYAKRVGSFAPVHREVAEYYNGKVRPAAVTSLHIVSHTFREAATGRIKVGGKAIHYTPIGTVWVDGERRMSADDIKSLLRRAGITQTRLGMLLRTHADVWLLEPT